MSATARPLSTPLRGGVLGLLLCQLGGCAMQPLRPRADMPVQAASARPASQAVAQQLTVVGRHGRLDAAARTSLLDRLARQGGGGLLNRQLAAMADFGEVDLYAHNQASLLIDGPATFAAMFEAIAQARQSVLLQSYIIEDSAIAQRLATLLARKRADGVAVAVLYDALGSAGTDGAYFAALRAAGISTCAINPLSPLKRPGYWNITERDHRKILAVDRGTGFTGGVNISGVYASGSFGRQRDRTPPRSTAQAVPGAGAASAASPGTAADSGASAGGWRDTQVRLQGPAVAALDDLVRATWLAQGCDGALPPPATPAAPGSRNGQGNGAEQVVRIVPSSPGQGGDRIYTLLLTAIDASQRSVYLTMAYFAPGQDMIDALCDAARRGVDVQLVLPSVSDFSPVLHAGRSHYQRLLDAGVQLHELQDAVLHAKTAVVDGVLSTVGSSNMDWRSFASNSEVNAVVLGEDFGDAMGRMFRQDVAASTTISAAAWAQRPLLQRARQGLARLFERFW